MFELKLYSYQQQRRKFQCRNICGLRTAYEILFKDAAKGDMLRYFYPYDDNHETASPFYSRLYQLRSKGLEELEERAISSLKFKQSNHYKEVPKDVNMRFVPFPLPGTMDLLRHKLFDNIMDQYHYRNFNNFKGNI